MNRILMGVIPGLGKVIRNVVDGNHPVAEKKDDENEKRETEITEKIHAGREECLVQISSQFCILQYNTNAMG